MNCLVVYAHPNPKSFNNAIKKTLEDSLGKNNDVKVRDLYGINFNAVLGSGELEALQRGEISSDVAEEQEHIKWADILFFVFPLWWAGPPSILRGYIDRVFSKGFAYNFGPGGLLKLLSDKKLQIITTLGESKENYEASGMFTSLKQTMGGVLGDFTGIEVLPFKFFTSVPIVSDEERKAMLSQIERLVDNIA